MYSVREESFSTDSLCPSVNVCCCSAADDKMSDTVSCLLLQIVIVISYNNIVVIMTKLEAVGVFQRVCGI